MKTLTNTQYTGRKAKIGSICFDQSGRLHVFVNYCTNCHGKVIMELGEARDFSSRYRTESERLKNRRLLKIVKTRTIL